MYGICSVLSTAKVGAGLVKTKLAQAIGLDKADLEEVIVKSQSQENVVFATAYYAKLIAFEEAK